MPWVTYVAYDGIATDIKVEVGLTVMEAAMRNGIPGIDADCGGVCACTTCHVYVDERWIPTIGHVSSECEAVLLGLAINRRENSRLSCQIRMTSELDGLVVRTPECVRWCWPHDCCF